MDKQVYEAVIRVLTLIIDKEEVDNYGLCSNLILDTQKNVDPFLNSYIPLWRDWAASGNEAYPITITGRPDKEYWEAKASNTLYADTPYGDARRRLAAFLRSKAEEELALLVGEEHE
jgi:hypothetical protein